MSTAAVRRRAPPPDAGVGARVGPSGPSGLLRALRTLLAGLLLAGLLATGLVVVGPLLAGPASRPATAAGLAHPGAFVAVDVFGLLTLAALARSRARDVVGAHVVVAYVLAPLLYHQAGATAAALAPRDHAAHLAALDRWLCGGVDPVAALGAWAAPAVTEALQWSYNAFWVMPLVLLLPLLRRGDAVAAAAATLALTSAVATTWLGFFVVPATGPGWHAVVEGSAAGPAIEPVLHRVTSDVTGTFATPWLRDLMAAADRTPFTSFPSGHVAATVVGAAIAFRVSRRVGWTFLPFAAAAVVSTVALRYHYLVDAIAGAACGVLCLPIAGIAGRGVARGRGGARR